MTTENGSAATPKAYRQRVGFVAEAPNFPGDWNLVVEKVKIADELGFDSIWVAESWGYELFTSMADLVRVTKKIKIGAGIANIYSRTPAVLATTAATLDERSGGRIILGLVFEGIVIMLIYALLAYQPQWWWLWVAIVLLFFSVIMANLAPVLIFPLFYKFTPLPEGELTERLMALAARARTKVRGVFSMHLSNKTTAANAALMGLGNTRRIVLGDTMTDRYSVDEIEVVLAHELGHHVHHDIWKLLLSQSVLMLGGLFLANLILHQVVETLHLYSSLTDSATLPFLFLLMGLFGLIVMPISNAFSRSVEYQADEYALQATHKVAAFKSAMTRLANQNLAEVEPAPIVEFLFHSHPSIRKRLQHADEFAGRQDLSTTPSVQS